jgi:hypothetical protein
MRTTECSTTALVPAGAGALVTLAGIGLVGVGIWARREVGRALAEERIVGTGDMTPPNAPVTSAAAARALSEVIRSRTVAAAGGRTYAETDEYLAAGGGTTPDAALALTTEAGQPVHNPSYELWVTSTTLQTALMQAYLAFRLADLTAGVGATLALAGAGIAASGRRS